MCRAQHSVSNEGGSAVNLRTAQLTVIILVFSLGIASAQDAAEGDPSESKISGGLSLFGGGDLFESSKNLRMAGESLERSGALLEGSADRIGQIVESVSLNLAEMSAGFDPLGYQQSYRTILQQSEIIHQQQETIQRLYEKEIQRLKKENRELRNSRKSETKKKKKKPKTAESAEVQSEIGKKS